MDATHIYIQCLRYACFRTPESEWVKMRRFKWITTWDSSLMLLMNKWMWSKMRASNQSSMTIRTKEKYLLFCIGISREKGNMAKKLLKDLRRFFCQELVLWAKKHLRIVDIITFISRLTYISLTQKRSEELVVKAMDGFTLNGKSWSNIVLWVLQWLSKCGPWSSSYQPHRGDRCKSTSACLTQTTRIRNSGGGTQQTSSQAF